MSLLGDIIDRVLFPNREIHAIPVLDGAFSPNQRLDRARRLGDGIESPDDIAPGPDGALYVSSRNRILRAAGDDFEKRELFVEFDAPVGGLAWSNAGTLLACVSGRGLVAIAQSGKIVGECESAGGETLTCPLSVTSASDGTIYLTDGSRANPPELWLKDMMERRPPSGRLVRCDAALRAAQVEQDGLDWPLGLSMSADESEVWIAESWAHRLVAFARSNGRKRVVVKNYAGYPARFSRSQSGDYWMAFFALRTQLTEFVLRERAFCEEMIRTVPPDLWIGPDLGGKINPREPTQIGRIKKLGIQKPWAPARSYGLVAHANGDGEALETFHSRVDGRVHGVMAVRRIGERVLAVSKGRDCLVELAPLQTSKEDG
ncbi:MAG: hypothetical protein ACK5JM_10150 [Rhodoblastus sp.]